MDLLLIILIGATGIWFGYKLAIRKKIKEVDYIPDKIETKKENVRKLLDVIKNHKEKITNNDVERILNVSDSTAERYLSDLVEAGALEQVGGEGRGVYYKRK